MARGNLFLGMGRGSIGDVTFYRADGKQLSRVRNRNPHNPKSKGQLYQRAIMATVIKAYQAGKAIFDHSFQGYSVGAQNQRMFMSLNAKMLRDLVATDINTPIQTVAQRARVVAPGSNTPVANPFIISRGSYQQEVWMFDDSNINFSMPAALENEKVSEYATRLHLVPGDIYTFVVFAERTDMAYVSSINDDALASLNFCDFGWVRCIVKSNIMSIQDAATGYNQLFDFQSSGGPFSTSGSMLTHLTIGQDVGIEELLPNDSEGYTETGGIGLIRSRLDQDLRSDSVMYVSYGYNADTMFGIASDYILDEWSSGSAQLGNSDLILEGGDA